MSNPSVTTKPVTTPPVEIELTELGKSTPAGGQAVRAKTVTPDKDAPDVSGKNPLPDAGLPKPSAQSTTAAARADAEKALARLAADTGTMVADIYSVLQLFQALAQSMRTVSRELRDRESAAQIKDLQDGASKLRDAAQARFTAAMVAGVVQTLGTLVSGALTLRSINKSASSAEQMKGLKDKSDKAVEAFKSTNQDAISAKRADLGKGVVDGVTGSLSKLAQGKGESNATKLEAEKLELDVKAKQHEDAARDAAELMQVMADIIREVRDTLAAIEQARQGSAATLTRV